MKNSIKNLIIKLGLKDFIKRSFPYRYYQHSVGNIMFPIYSLGWFIAKILVPRRSVTLNGIVLSLPVRNWITHFRWYLIKQKEPEVRHWVDQDLKDDDVLYDIGGNIGLISMYAAKRFKKMKIIAFEPEYSNLALFKENLKFNGLKERVEIYSVGLSDHDGLSHLYIQDDGEGAAAHSESNVPILKTDEGYDVVWREGIACFKLDTFVQMSGLQPSALKIDTDGNELKILLGSQAVLANKALRTIIIETPVKDDAKSIECRNILLGHGFSEKKRSGIMNVVWERVN